MMHDMLQRAADKAMAMGPTVLLQGMRLQQPIDVVKPPSSPMKSERSSPPGRLTITLLIPGRRSVNCQAHRRRSRSMTCSLPSRRSLGAKVSD